MEIEVGKSGLEKIIRRNPNRLYGIVNRTTSNRCQYDTLLTDGKQHTVSEDEGQTAEWRENYPGACCYELYEDIEVADATWVVIVRKVTNGLAGGSTTIEIITEKELSELDLPSVNI